MDERLEERRVGAADKERAQHAQHLGLVAVLHVGEEVRDGHRGLLVRLLTRYYCRASVSSLSKNITRHSAQQIAALIAKREDSQYARVGGPTSVTSTGLE